MPDTNHYSGVPVPTKKEAANGPAAFAAFRAAIGPQLVLHATSAAHRNSEYLDVPPGTVVSSPEANAVWMRTASGWDTLYEDTGWIALSSPDLFEPGWTDVGCQYRIRNGVVQLYWKASFSGTAQTPNADTGKLPTDEKVLTLPASASPEFGVRGQFVVNTGLYFGSFVVFNTGSLTCTHLINTDWWANNTYEGYVSYSVA